MTRLRPITAALATLALSLASATAAATTVSLTQLQTSSGQNFVFTFAGLSDSFTGDGLLTFRAYGDYSPGYSGPASPSEVMVGSAEGIAFGTMGYDNADAFFMHNVDTSNRPGTAVDFAEWRKSFVLSNAQLHTLLADNLLEVKANLSYNVNLFDPGFAFASVSFTYTPVVLADNTDVPEPGSLALMGIALAGLLAARRRKQSVPQ